MHASCRDATDSDIQDGTEKKRAAVSQPDLGASTKPHRAVPKSVSAGRTNGLARYDFLLVFYSDLRSRWNHSRVISD